jgi:hypothetical protein
MTPLPASSPPQRVRGRAAVLLAAGTLAGLGLIAGFTGVWDPDFFHHLAMGRAVATGADFSSDPLVYAFAEDLHGLPPYWLGSLLVYLPTALFGTTGSLALAAILIATTATLVFIDARDGSEAAGAVPIAFAFALLTLPELRIRSAPRPELFGGLLLVLTLLAIRRFERGRPRLLLWLPVAMLAWGQLHVSVAMGLGALGLYAAWRLAHALWRRARAGIPDGAANREVAMILAVLGISLALVLFTPAGRSSVELARTFLGSLVGSSGPPGGSGVVIESFRQTIEELHPPSASDASRPFALLAFAALASFLLHRSRDFVREALTVLTFALFSATAFRFAPLAAVVAAPVAARNVAAWYATWRAGRSRHLRWLPLTLALLAFLRAVTLPTLPAQPFSTRLENGMFPVRAADYLRRLGFDGRAYNDLGAGGYLEWALGVRVFQDGRGPARPDDLPERFPEPVDARRMALLDARWHYEALVLPLEGLQALAGTTGGRPLDAPGGLVDSRVWALVAVDDGAALFLRRQGRWGAAAARDELPSMLVALTGEPLAPSDPAAATQAAELARVISDAPSCVQCRVNLAAIRLRSWDFATAESLLSPVHAFPVPRLRATVAMLRGSAAEGRADHAAAELHYREAIACAADPAPRRRVLAIMLFRIGRLADVEPLLASNLATGRTSADLSLAAAVARQGGDAARAEALEREAFAAAQREDAERRGSYGQAPR